MAETGTRARSTAIRLNQAGLDAEDRGAWHQVESLYRCAAAADETWDVPWFNLGLHYKRQGLWRESLAANEEAARRITEREGEPALWNLGIAATALSDWARARWAWCEFGISVPDGEGPIEMRLGTVPIRLSPSGEVVWCARLDPARGRILNVPMVGHQWGDLVLHDGSPCGHRRLGDREVPVFDQLELLERSPFLTFETEVTAASDEDCEALSDVFNAAGLAAQDWTSSIRLLCRACSEGTPHDHEETHAEPSTGWATQRSFGLAAPDRRAATALLGEWKLGGRGRAFRLLA